MNKGDIQEMAITGEILSIILRYTFLGQKCQTGQFYTPGGAAFLPANADAVGAAWWANCMTGWRDLIVDSPTEFTFDSVFVEELDGGLAFGEFPVPSGERAGTRDGTGLGDFMPSYCAAGMRLTVATRSTRPGQKRFPGLTQGDVLNNAVEAPFLALLEDVAPYYDQTIVLGAPVALGTLTPKIIHFPTPGDPTQRAQDVQGHITNPYATSQVSRRIGHGS